VDTTQLTAVTEMIGRVLAVVGYPGDQDPDLDQQVKEDVETAFRWIKSVTNRDWALTSGPSPRSWDAPPSSLLNLPDINPLPTPAITLEGTLLIAGIEYRLKLNRERTAYTQVERRANGLPALWTDGVTDVADAIVVEADFSLPDEVGDVWEAKSVQLFRNRDFQYAGGGGNAALGQSGPSASDTELEGRLLPYWRPPVRQVLAMGAG
jgi:hypothetical protein